MRADFDVLIDACVLANHGVCDLLLSLAERPRLFVPHWTAKILCEVERTHRDKLGWPANLVNLFQKEIATAFPEAEIHGYEGFIEGLTNDLKDRHVLAAAICGRCPVILTFNLRHFKNDNLQDHGIVAMHPDDYLVTLFEIEPSQVIAVLGEIAGRRRMKTEEVLIRYGTVIPKFSARVHAYLSE